MFFKHDENTMDKNKQDTGMSQFNFVQCNKLDW